MTDSDSLRRIEVNGTEIHYLEQGEGIPIVFIHGSLADYRTWRAQVRFFSRSFHVLAPSLRYHFPNAIPAGEPDYSPYTRAADLAAVLGCLQLQPAHIVASSYGAYAALFLAMERPEMVRSLVLAEPPILPLLRETAEGTAQLEKFIDLAWEPAYQAILAGKREHGVRLFLDAIMLPGAFDSLPPAAVRGIMENFDAKQAEMMTPRSRHFPPVSVTQAQSIQSPALLLTGEQSPRMFHDISTALCKRLKKGCLVSIPGASHAIHLSSPKVYNETVKDFILEGSRLLSSF